MTSANSLTRPGTMAAAALMIVLAAAVLLFGSGDERTILLPIAAGLLFIIPALVNLFERNGGVPFDDIGALYLVILMLYFVVPIATYWARGMRFTPYNDSRLYAAMPSPAQMAAIEWRYVAYILPCLIAYLVFAPKCTSGRTRTLKADPRSLFWSVLILIGLETIVKAFEVVNGITGATYGDVVQRAYEVYHTFRPVILVQIEAHADGMLVVAQAAALIFLFRDYKKYRILLFLWLLTEAIIAVEGLGSRSPLVFLVLMMAILYDRFVKRIKLSLAIAGGLLLLTGYMIFGLVRGYSNPQAHNATLLTANNEFEALFANAFDLYRRAENDVLPPVPPQVRFNDFIAPIPSQFLPFEKLDESTWYTRILGVEDTGGAYAFGVMAESAIGWGTIELLLKGLLTGYLLARMQRWYKFNSSNYWVLVIYLYLEVSCYWLFRSGCFYLLPLFFFNVLPFYTAVRLLSGRTKREAPEAVSGYPAPYPAESQRAVLP